MNTIEPLNNSSFKSKRLFSVVIISCILGLACQERRVGAATKSTVIEPVKISAKSKGGEFRASSVSANAFAIKPKSGFKINVEYPWKMVALDPKVTVGKIELDEKTATIGITLPKEMVDQKKDFKVKGSFSVCNDEKCLIYRDEEINLTQVP